MRIFPACLFILFSASATADERVAVDFRCLSGGSKNSIHLEWRVFTDIPARWETAYVKYRNSPKPIPLVLKSKEEAEIAEGRPWHLTTIWLEVVDGKITGEYEVSSQGARIYGFTYKNYRNSQIVHFSEDHAAHEDDGCKWK